MKDLTVFKIFFRIVACLVVLFNVLPLQQAEAQDLLYNKHKLKIVTTTGHIADLVRNIVGDRMDVEALMGTGSDPHLYRPTRSDLVKLRRADIVFYNGLHLEAQLTDVFKKLADTRPNSVIAISTALDDKDLIYDEGASYTYDPHVWMNVNNWAQVIDLVLKTITPFDEPNSDLYKEAAAEYREKLDKLDYRIQVAIATIPRNKRVLITAHDAFGYLGQAYGMAVLGVQGLSTESEAGLKRIESMIELIVDRGIEAVFTESSVDDRNIKALIEGAAARNHHVFEGGELYSDALGPEGSFGDNYIGMMVHNVSLIAEALGGDSKALDDYRKAALRD